MNKFSKYDIKEHFEKFKKGYLVLLFCFILGIIIGIIISISKINFLGLLNIKDKNIISIINGTFSFSTFWANLFSFVLPIVIILLLSLNFYVNFLSYLLFIYQSSLLFLTSLAIVNLYGFLGFLKVLFIILPINIIYFFCLSFIIVVSFKRSYMAMVHKSFSYGFDRDFFIKIAMCLLCVIILVLITYLLLPLLLKSAIFIIF